MSTRCDGFCKLDDVLTLRRFKRLQCTVREIEEVVKDNGKQRFELKVEHHVLLIRAEQGHSIKDVHDEELLRRLDLSDKDLPHCRVHGTYWRHFESIKAEGLRAGGGQIHKHRNHVHFASCEPGDNRVISGMRHNCDIGIWIDLRKALKDGVPFYMSANEVILTPGIEGWIDKKYLLKAKDFWSQKKLRLL